MKINNKDLKDLYRSYIIDNTPPNRKNCPPTKEIINLFGKTSKKQKLRIIDHISSCYLCLQEFEFILKTLRIEKKLSADIGNLLRKEQDYLLIKGAVDKKDFSRIKKIFLCFPQISWKYASLFAGIILLISVVATLFILQNNEKKEYRGAQLTPIKLFEPLIGKYSKSILKFRWVEIKGSDYYVIELFDEALRPIWKSKKIYTNHTVLPKRILESLRENKKYFWMISAYFSDGRKVESRLEYFNLTE